MMYDKAIGAPLGRYYSLQHLQQIDSLSWECIIRDPCQNESRFVWTTGDSTLDVQDRAIGMLLRHQAEYAARIHGKRATSHWHKLAVTGSKNDNLTIIKAKNRARIEEWMRSKGKRA